MKKTINMTTGVIWKRLLFFAVPLILGDMLQQLYNTVDSVIVGRFVGKQALAAVSSTSCIVNIFVGLFSGIGAGATIAIARYFGSDDRDMVQKAVHTTVTLSLVLGAAITAVGWLGTPLMLRVMSTPEDVFPEAVTYLRIYFAGISGLVVYNMGSGILRAVGDSRRPLICLAVCSVLNMGLDVLLVIGLGLGVAGAAAATIAAQFLSAGLLFFFLTRKDTVYCLHLHRLGMDAGILRSIIDIGLPIGVQKSLISLSNTMVVSRINYFGSSAAAAWGVYRKLDQVVTNITQNMSVAVSTFTSQNIGAGKTDRVKGGARAGYFISISVAALLDLLMLLFRKPLISLFILDSEVQFYGSVIFCTILPWQFLTSIVNVQGGVLRGQGDSRGPMLIMLLSYIAVRQAYLFIGWHWIRSLAFIASCYPFAWISAVLMLTVYRRRRTSGSAG